MKRYLLYILLIINSICYGQIYSTGNRMYGTMSTPSYDNYKNINGGSNVGYSSPNIGYSTSKYGMTNTYNMYERQYNNVYSGTYNPGSSSRSGQPRRVKGYTIDGDSINTDGMGNPSDPSKGMWLDGYNYYYEDNYWYRGHYDKRGNYIYEKWSSVFDADWLFWNWYSGRNPGDDAIQYYQNNPKPHPYDPYADPIGEFPIGLLLILSFLFVYYKKLKNKTN